MSNLKKTLHNMVDNLPEDKLLLVKEFLDDLFKAYNEDKTWLEADLGELPPYEWESNKPPK